MLRRLLPRWAGVARTLFPACGFYGRETTFKSGSTQPGAVARGSCRLILSDGSISFYAVFETHWDKTLQLSSPDVRTKKEELVN